MELIILVVPSLPTLVILSRPMLVILSLPALVILSLPALVILSLPMLVILSLSKDDGFADRGASFDKLRMLRFRGSGCLGFEAQGA